MFEKPKSVLFREPTTRNFSSKSAKNRREMNNRNINQSFNHPKYRYYQQHYHIHMHEKKPLLFSEKNNNNNNNGI